MASESQEFPPRLIEGDDRQAELLRRALAEPSVGPSEQRSWQRLDARLQRGAPRVLVPVLAGALTLMAVAAWLNRPRGELALSPEHLTPRSAAPPSATSSRPQVTPTTASPAQRAPSVLRLEPAPSPAPSAPSSTEGDTAACAKLAKSAEYAAATACYGRVARGSNMTAELALYEKARLEAKALGNGAQALSTLDEHRRRFPGGVLTSEVAFTRIDLLMQLGKRAEALVAIEQGLPGALGRERGADLQLMRASLLASGGSCSAALQAAREARDAGADPSRLEAIEQRCSPPPRSPEAP